MSGSSGKAVNPGGVRRLRGQTRVRLGSDLGQTWIQTKIGVPVRTLITNETSFTIQTGRATCRYIAESGRHLTQQMRSDVRRSERLISDFSLEDNPPHGRDSKSDPSLTLV